MANANLATFFVLLIAIQACLFLYQGQDVPTVFGNNLWDLAWNWQSWGNTAFILGFVGIAGTITAVGAFAGTALGFKTNTMIFSVAVLGFLQIGAVFVSLGRVIRSDFGTLFGCARVLPGVIAPTCDPVTWIIMVLVAPVMVYYIMAVVGWWTVGNQN